MAQNASNTAKPELNPVVEEVLKILGSKVKKADISPGSFRQQIDSILQTTSGAMQNKNLALYLIQEVDAKYFHKIDPSLRQEREIVIAAIIADPDVFDYIDPKFQKDLGIAKEYVMSLVRKQVGFLQVNRLLEQFFSGTPLIGTLFSFYKSYLQVAEYIFHSDVEKQLLALKQKDTPFFQLLLDKKVFEQRGRKIVLSYGFTEFFLAKISHIPDFATLEKSEKTRVKIEIFLEYLGITEKELTPERTMFLETVIDTITFKQEKQKAETEKQDDTKDKGTSTPKTQPDTPAEQTTQRLSFCVPHCQYTARSGGGYDISISGTKIHLSQDELDTMPNRALENYIATVKLFQEIGLGFVLQFKNQFLGVICGIDYLYGEGLSEGKRLKILNKVGKKVGIPEKTYVSSEGGEKEAQKEVGCFSTYGEAVFQFRQIQESGYINGEWVVDLAQAGRRSVVEIDLIRKGYFDAEGNGFLRITDW